ncbi:MAG: hypothetical protein GY762_17400 [Proteobacteria bacterium]|nr:hypothetical protein [Pseudomonadota bacterium]
MHVLCHHGTSLLEKRGFQPEQEILDKVSEQDDADADKSRALLCAKCGFPITTKDQRIEMNGLLEHTFANPHGIIYRIGCFRSAPGCAALSEEYREFTWFEGYAWAHAMCSLCGNHMGWKYRMEQDSFHGLVLDRLIEKDGS